MASTTGIGMSMWKSMQAWNSVRAAASQRSLNEQADAASAFQTAWNNQINGTATLITKMTQKRVAAELQAKLKKIQTTMTGVNKVA